MQQALFPPALRARALPSRGPPSPGAIPHISFSLVPCASHPCARARRVLLAGSQGSGAHIAHVESSCRLARARARLQLRVSRPGLARGLCCARPGLPRVAPQLRRAQGGGRGRGEHVSACGITWELGRWPAGDGRTWPRPAAASVALSPGRSTAESPFRRNDPQCPVECLPGRQLLNQSLADSVPPHLTSTGEAREGRTQDRCNAWSFRKIQSHRFIARGSTKRSKKDSMFPPSNPGAGGVVTHARAVSFRSGSADRPQLLRLLGDGYDRRVRQHHRLSELTHPDSRSIAAARLHSHSALICL
jgi:hypothetical protein